MAYQAAQAATGREGREMTLYLCICENVSGGNINKVFDQREAAVQYIEAGVEGGLYYDAQMFQLESVNWQWLSLNLTDRTYLNCPFEEKDIVKERGAKWDAEVKKWYIHKADFPHTYEDKFARWLPSQDEIDLDDEDFEVIEQESQ